MTCYKTHQEIKAELLRDPAVHLAYEAEELTSDKSIADQLAAECIDVLDNNSGNDDKI